jgi:hypothetical protein
VVFIIAFSVFLGLLLGANLHVLPTALAENGPVTFPTRAYTAEYENVQSNDPRGPDHRRISCNGKGLLIYEWNKLRFLYDAHKQLEYIIDPSNKNVYIHRLKRINTAWLEEELFSPSPLELPGFKQLGEEKVIGYDCQLYVNRFQHGTEKRWYDRDTNVLVYRKLDSTVFTIVTKLLNYSSQALSTSEFELPKVYNIIDCTK